MNNTIFSPFLCTQDDLCSPLHVACVNSHYAMAKLLMMNGASIHDEDANGMTPILRLLIPETFDIKWLSLINVYNRSLITTCSYFAPCSVFLQGKFGRKCGNN